MTEASARVIADSITEQGHRLTTFEATCWRPVLAEQNTHRVLSRNSASSRAIPVTKQLTRFKEDFAAPLVWPKEKRGMQGGTGLEGTDLEDAQDLWDDLQTYVYVRILDYVTAHPDEDTRLHKSMLNRWLEVGLWQTQVISGTNWEGYFWQRCHKDAEPHIRAMAEAMQTALRESEPKTVGLGDWHLPYWGSNGGHESDWDDARQLVSDGTQTYDQESRDNFETDVSEVAKRCSTARCARTSYMTQSGVRDLSEDLNLYARLTENRVGSEDPPHASPLEHVATPWADNEQYVVTPKGDKMGPLPKLGNYVGWLQLRHDVLGF